jgi:uncharacterized membrane protein
MSPLIFVTVFFATLCIDALYALYTIHVTEKKAFQSATFGSLIHILTAFTVISYTKNYLYLVPLVVGSFIGTYFAVTYTKKQ